MAELRQKQQNWAWKNKNGERGGLLYDSGNWGDILKMLWLVEIIRWKQDVIPGAAVHYTDPFAGDVRYPLGKKQAFRLDLFRRLCRREHPETALDFLQKPFFDKGLWPSAASGALLLVNSANGTNGTAEVWDIDAGRREAWRAAGIKVTEDAASGWDIVARAAPDSGGLLLVDPYDFLAEWEKHLPLLVEKSTGTSVLLYLYNRSGKNKEAFAGYRRFRGRLDDLTEDNGRPKRVGRIAADGFLPDAWHEMVFLPCAADAERPDFAALLDRLGGCAAGLHGAQTKSSVFDC